MDTVHAQPAADDVSANMKATDEARKEAFAGVVKQEKDEKTRVDAITKSHGGEADKAAAETPTAVAATAEIAAAAIARA